ANGDTRTLTFHHTHRDDSLTITYKKNGQFDEDALKKLNYFLRDWRTDEQTNMDRRLFDILWEVYGEVGGKDPINIVSSYRSPATNAMLRRRSRGVAKFSQHMLGHAIDFYIPNVQLEDIRNAGLRLQRGGVGFYPTSGSPFVHLDVGGVRHWPRMTHDQLAKVFPDGRTVHIPTDGQPLKGYALALADIEKRGSSPSAMSLEAASNGGVQVASAGQPKRSFLASTFRANHAHQSAQAPAPAAPPTPVPRPAPGRAPAAATKSTPTKVATVQTTSANVPMPSTRPTVLASAAPQTSSTERQAVALRGTAPAQQQAPNSINDIINSRGFWQGVMTAPAETAAAPAPAAKVATASNSKFPRWPYADKDKDVDDATSSVLAYSKSNEPDPAPKAQAMGSSMGSAASGRATTASLGPSGLSTIVQKSLAPLRQQQAAPAPTMLPPSGKWAAMAPSLRSDDPWMRAIVLSPSV